MTPDIADHADAARQAACEVGSLCAPVRGVGEWDWYWALIAPERRRLATYWCSEYGSSPDVLVDHYGSIDRWLDLTRIADLPRVLRAPAMRGRDVLAPLGCVTLAQQLGVEVEEEPEPPFDRHADTWARRCGAMS